jgi:hypothetical protein
LNPVESVPADHPSNYKLRGSRCIQSRRSSHTDRGKMVSSCQLKCLLLFPFLVSIAFGSNDVDNSLETQERNIEETDFNRMKREILETLRTERSQMATYGGAVYTRWGRTVCGPGSDVMYKGVAGGSWYHSYGGGSNYLCLPMQPIWGAYNEAVVKASKLHGSEYEAPSGFRLNNNNNLPLHDNNVPCVVCRSQTKTSVIMIPARNQCYSGMHTEYVGYLMSGHPSHVGRTEFVCVDGEPESDPYGYRNEEGAQFWNVEGVCGSLPCPPYTQRREITCAVCTK